MDTPVTLGDTEEVKFSQEGEMKTSPQKEKVSFGRRITQIKDRKKGISAKASEVAKPAERVSEAISGGRSRRKEKSSRRFSLLRNKIASSYLGKKSASIWKKIKQSHGLKKER